MDTINFLHTLFHSVAGVDYPGDHWSLDLGAALLLIVAPAWSVWIAARFFVRRSRNWRRGGLVSGKAVGTDGTRKPADGRKRSGTRWRLETFVLRATAGAQLRVAVLCLLTLPAAWLLLEIPKRIINQVLADAAGSYADGRKELLFTLCAAYLAVLTLNGLIKYWTNRVRGFANERLVRRLRLAIVRRLRRERSDQRRATFAAVAVQEVEAIGYFGGGLVAVPMLQGGAFLISIAFLLIQNAALALAALVMLPFQLSVLPRMQRRLNVKVRERVYLTRTLGALLTATDDGSGSTDAPVAQGETKRAVLERRMRQTGELERVRNEINELKGRLKGLYNYTSNLTPFFLFLIGGYLVVEGQLSLGALVAALAAYKELAPALRELFDFAQIWSDARSRFEEVSKTIAETD